MQKNENGFRLLWLLFVIGLALPGWAQVEQSGSTATSSSDSPPKFTMNALADTYYSFNFTNAAHNADGIGNVGYFPNGGEGDYAYALSLAELSFTLRQGDGKVHLSVLGGNIANYFESFYVWQLPPSGIYIWEAYVSYQPQEWTFTFGQMATHMGFEVLESNENWNYSRSLLFTDTLPHFHDGFSVNYTTPDKKLEITGYVYDGWNNGGFTLPLNQGKTYGAKIDGEPVPDLDIVLRGITGPMGGYSTPPPNDNLFASYVAEGTLVWKATDKFSVALDGEYQSENPTGTQVNKAWGGALYCRYQIRPDWAAALRLEGVKFSAGTGTNPYMGFPPLLVPALNDEGREITLTLEHHFTKTFLARVEGRYDCAYLGGKALSAGGGPFAGSDPDQLTATGSVVFSL